MQNPSAIRTRSRAAAPPVRELSWSFMLLVLVCACVVATGFFFAARQHFTSMDYGLKNSKLREQLQNLETEKRRLLLAREVALSPMAIRKASRSIGLREGPEIAAVETSSKTAGRSDVTVVRAVRKDAEKLSTTPAVVRTVLSTPVQTKPAASRSTGEVRSRVVDSSKDKKEKNEMAALLKLK